mgnify:CR=1 FL=1
MIMPDLLTPAHTGHVKLPTIGQRFGRLVILALAPSRGRNNETMVWVRCDCGKDPIARYSEVRTGKKVSCGCIRYGMPIECRIHFAPGTRFGRWTVLGEGPRHRKRSGQSMRRMHVRCDCGAERDVLLRSLQDEKSVSCGCYLRDWVVKTKTRHGEAKANDRTREYGIWRGVKSRCLNPKSTSYGYYGGRGITVCARWIDSYEAFLADMGRAPSLLYSIDRIDTDGNYEPSNCRWATHAQQNNNRRVRIVLGMDQT